MRTIAGVIGVALLALGNVSHARCPLRADVLDYVLSYVNKTPAKAIPGIETLLEAYCSQGQVASELGRHKGNIAGYKAGFTSKAMQQKFNIDSPVRAFLFEKMFLQDGAEVPADFGARPLYEADFIAIVKDTGIHDAKTALQTLEHIEAVVPFIELGDLMLAADQPLTALTLIATNVGTRLGVLGAPIPVQATQQFLDQLATMTIIITDQDGRELGSALGAAMLDNPINSVMWLAQDLAKNGQRIQAGDKLSLGSFMPAQTPHAGLQVKVQYVGLPGDPSVSVRFK